MYFMSRISPRTSIWKTGMPELSAAMFAHGIGVVANFDIWHKRIGHVNV